MNGEHFQESISSRKEATHNQLHQILSTKLIFLVCQLNIKLLDHVSVFLSVVSKDRLEKLVNGVQNEHVESTLI
jgi:hypothetical protein